ncbi:hypothetical protein L1077_23125 [Pseudoalteromonas luteoviolacea]|uniref:hypothetical protein n=1 Tax=Pseudoalteromonas luteoviolacea TaxID=43657 RepID=UPI001F369D5D|nr:hypothetical protein [Pseudoalteromonas luteoviolacea]MCF6442323.1 hypothetical protein [Pseudoalteromonas luteoviolacea]
MTTIAYSKEHAQIACDSQTTDGSVIVSNTTKKWFNTRCGSRVFSSGDTLDIYAFEQHYKNGAALPTSMNLVKYIRITPGRVFYGEVKGGVLKEEALTTSHAIGSGDKYALAEMTRGGDARAAVQLSSELDTQTNDNIHTFCTQCARKTQSCKCRQSISINISPNPLLLKSLA